MGFRPKQGTVLAAYRTSVIQLMASGIKHYDLLRNNCWILSTSISALTLFHYFQYEFDQASRAELVASRSAGPIRHMVSRFFSGPNRFLNWKDKGEYRRQAE